MSVTLIYHGSRLRGRGFVTLTGGAALGDEHLKRHLAAARAGKAEPGTILLRQTLKVDGREVNDLLIFCHGRSLAPVREQEISAYLARLSGTILQDAFDRASSQSGGDPASVQAALDDMTRRIAADLPRPSRRRMYAAFAGVAGATVVGAAILIGAAGRVYETAVPQVQDLPVPTEEALVSNSDLDALIKSCWSDSLPETRAGVGAAFVGRTFSAHSSEGLRDYTQHLAATDAAIFQLDGAGPRDVCDARRAIWSSLSQFGAPPAPLDPYAKALQRSGAHETFAIAEAAARIWSMAAPELPADCAAGICLPIYSAADIAALHWIDTVYAELPANLRQAERDMRGELALHGEEVETGNRLGMIWSCEGSTCESPMRALAERIKAPAAD